MTILPFFRQFRPTTNQSSSCAMTGAGYGELQAGALQDIDRRWNNEFAYFIAPSINANHPAA